MHTEAFPERSFQGSVRSIAPMGERIQNVTYFEVQIEIVDPDSARLLPRMSGDADIVTETVEDALVIPETALHYRGEDLYVEIDGPEPEDRRIEIGIVDGSRVQILEGLEPGDEVAIR